MKCKIYHKIEWHNKLLVPKLIFFVETWWPKRGNCYNPWCGNNKTTLFFEKNLTCVQWTIMCQGQWLCNAINSYKYCGIKKKNVFGQTRCWVKQLKPIQEMVKEPKLVKLFSLVLSFKCFHNHNFFSLCLSIACIIIYLEVYFGKKWKLLKFCIFNCDGPYNNHIL
jgi:hypothetical protein